MSPGRKVRLLNRAFALHRAGAIVDALDIYRRVIEADPRDPKNSVAWHQAAIATWQLLAMARTTGRAVDLNVALRFMDAAIGQVSEFLGNLPDQRIHGGIAHDIAGIVHNYAKFLRDFGSPDDLEAVIQAYGLAVNVDPSLGEAWTNLGNALGDAGDREAAEQCWNRALECPRATPESRFNISMLYLLRGDYLTGWAEYEHRWESVTFKSNFGRPDLTGPRWDGAPMAGTLYLHDEQGAGDVLQMGRYIPLAQQRVGKVIVEVRQGLVSLFRATFPDVEVRAAGEAIPEYDAHLPMMSCPWSFQTTLETVPPPVGYGHPGIVCGVAPPESGRIGLCWKGSANHPNDRMRSMSWDMMRGLLEVPGKTFVSLQYGEAPDRIEPLPEGDYLSTAREIARCERVITVDTSVAHLAGSIGVPTALLLPFNAEWRWLQDREDTPWYPSMRLFRQREAGNWTEVIERVKGEL